MPESLAEDISRDLVVVLNTSLPNNAPGRFALVRAAEWCSDTDPVVVWHGPELPDVRLSRDVFREISCRTVLVDRSGFYTCQPTEEPVLYPCPQLDEEIREAVEEEGEKILNILANERAAESQSYVDHEGGREFFGADVWAMAKFGDAVAVNGELVTGRHPKPPRRWVETDKGGVIPGGEEEEIDKEWLVGGLTYAVSEVLKRDVPEWMVARAVDEIWDPGKSYIMWMSDSGDAEIWTSKRALRQYEKEEEERYARESEAAQRRRLEERRREEEERRERVKRGGFPSARDWSPRGELPRR